MLEQKKVIMGFKYLYFTIYYFYNNILKIKNWNDTPHFYANIILALLQTMIIFSCYNYYLIYRLNIDYIHYSKWWFFGIGMVLFFINKKCYSAKRVEGILKSITSKSKNNKIFIIILSIIFIIAIVKIFFHTGDLIAYKNRQ